MLVFIFGFFGEVFEAGFGKVLQSLGLGKECRAKPAFDAALANAASKASDSGGTASDAGVRVFAVGEDAVGDDAASVGLRQFDKFSPARGFFIEDCAKLGLCDGLLKDGVFGAVKIFPPLFHGYRGHVEWPHANFSNLKGVEDVHGNSVGALVVEMASDSAAQALVRLADVNWFAVVVEEGVDAPLLAADSLSVIGGCFEEGVDLLAYRDYVSGWS